MTDTPAYLRIYRLLLFFFLILLAGCAPSAHINTPNNVQKTKVVLYLTDASKIPGEITIPFEQYASNKFVLPSAVYFIREGQRVTERIDLKNILGYAYGTDYFALKRVDIDQNNVVRMLFLKRLSPEKSKIQLYELYESGYGSPTGESRYSYFLSLPGYSPLTTINARSPEVVPNFDEKFSKIVADCPVLADKIKNKEKGYFLPAVTFDAKRPGEVLLKIINEYVQCQ